MIMKVQTMKSFIGLMKMEWYINVRGDITDYKLDEEMYFLV